MTSVNKWLLIIQNRYIQRIGNLYLYVKLNYRNKWSIISRAKKVTNCGHLPLMQDGPEFKQSTALAVIEFQYTAAEMSLKKARRSITDRSAAASQRGSLWNIDSRPKTSNILPQLRRLNATECRAVFYACWRSPPSAPQGTDRTRESHDLLTHTYYPPCRYQAGKFCLSQSFSLFFPSSLALSFHTHTSGYLSLLFPRRLTILSIPPSTTRNCPRRSRILSARSILVYLITCTCIRMMSEEK